jgi:hypothetical protein
VQPLSRPFYRASGRVDGCPIASICKFLLLFWLRPECAAGAALRIQGGDARLYLNLIPESTIVYYYLQNMANLQSSNNPPVASPSSIQPHPISSQNFCTLGSCPSRCARQRKVFEGHRAAHLRPGGMALFEPGKVFIWGDVVFGKLHPVRGGQVAFVTNFNSDKEKFLELRYMPGEVWQVRRGGRPGRWLMYPDNFPKLLSCIVRKKDIICFFFFLFLT